MEHSDVANSASPDSSISEEEARLAVASLLADPGFKATDRHRRFLRFVADETFAGRSAAIKAYSIAVDVFGRPTNFDPATDPIVRIEATRLRACLAHYYEREDPERTFRVELPKGGYVPAFSRLRRECQEAPTETPVQQDPAEREAEALPSAVTHPETTAVGRLGRFGWLGIVLGVCLAVFFVQQFVPVLHPPSLSVKPMVSLSVVAADPSQAAPAAELRNAMLTTLSQFQTVRIASGDLPSGNGGERGRQSVYRIEVKHAVSDFYGGAWWQLVDAETGESIQSGIERVFVNARSQDEVRTRLAGALAVAIVGGRGAIATADTARELNEPTLGYGCVLRGALALQGTERAALDKSRTCLERSLDLRANDPDTKAMLALVLLKIDRPEAPTVLSPNALLLAVEAVRLNPFSDRASGALMVARFRNGQVEAGLMAGRQAMELNPNNGAIPVKLGSMLFRIGRWEEASRMLARAREIGGEVYPEADITRAMDAYRRGDYREALNLVQRTGELDCVCARVLRAATFAQLGMRDEAKAAADELRRDRPEFEWTYRVDMAARHFDVVLIDGLQAGLVKAGLVVR